MINHYQFMKDLNKRLDKTRIIVYKMYKDLKIRLKEITEAAKKENYCKK